MCVCVCVLEATFGPAELFDQCDLERQRGKTERMRQSERVREGHRETERNRAAVFPTALLAAA